MTRDDTRGQVKALADRLFPVINYLLRLKTRREAKGFEPAVPLFGKLPVAFNHQRIDVMYRVAEGARLI